jgi:CheY-like chemotaxis protein
MSAVLIIDDDVEGSEPVAKYLRQAGHRVVCAPNGREALALLTGVLPDLVLLDMRMPEMDGVSFLAVLRSYLRWQDLPVILYTAFTEGPHIEQARRLNAREVFKKGSVDLKELVACIDRVIAEEKPPRPEGPRPEGESSS